MDIASADIIQLLNYLLPGFITALIYYGLTAHKRPNQFERIVQAFIFTIVIQFLVKCIEWLTITIGNHWFQIGEWSPNVSLGMSILLAMLIGLIASKMMNYDILHRWLRTKKITKETSHPTEWYGVFVKYQTYVVLHLEDGRRIYGWPEEWPSDPTSGHFSLAEAEWLLDDSKLKDNKKSKKLDSNKEHLLDGRLPLDDVDCVLIPAKMVQFVEFMKLKFREGGNESE